MLDFPPKASRISAVLYPLEKGSFDSPDFSLIHDPLVQIHGGQVRVGHEEHREAAGAGRETSSLGSRLLQADIARLSSHWTGSCITVPSLVERFKVMPFYYNLK